MSAELEAAADNPLELPPGPHGTPSPALPERQRRCPVAPMTVPSGASILTAVQYHDVRALLASEHSSRERLCTPGMPRLAKGMSFEDVAKGVLMNLDGAAHAGQRGILKGLFTEQAAEQLRPACADIAHDLLDPVRGSEVDIVTGYALPLSSHVICQVLGVPPADYPRFHQWSSAFLTVSAASAETRAESYAAFQAYAASLIATHRSEPGRELIDDLIRAELDGRPLGDDVLINLLIMLMIAGHETTAMMISRGVLRLLLHPEQYQALVNDRQLIAPAVEEILRFDGPGSSGLLRYLTAQVELPSGTTVGAETAVLPHLWYANHCPHAFHEPARFDIRRYAGDTPARPHLAFGHGRHFCLGRALGRMVLQEALRALILVAPNIRPAVALDDIPWSGDALNQQPIRLPVVLT
ncbi:cytochrome P450 [Nonomuraea fuscirosea]